MKNNPIYAKALSVLNSARTKEQFDHALNFVDLSANTLDKKDQESKQFKTSILKEALYKRHLDKEDHDRIKDIQEELKDGTYFDSHAASQIEFLLNLIMGE